MLYGSGVHTVCVPLFFIKSGNRTLRLCSNVSKVASHGFPACLLQTVKYIHREQADQSPRLLLTKQQDSLTSGTHMSLWLLYIWL